MFFSSLQQRGCLPGEHTSQLNTQFVCPPRAQVYMPTRNTPGFATLSAPQSYMVSSQQPYSNFARTQDCNFNNQNVACLNPIGDPIQLNTSQDGAGENFAGAQLYNVNNLVGVQHQFGLAAQHPLPPINGYLPGQHGQVPDQNWHMPDNVMSAAHIPGGDQAFCYPATAADRFPMAVSSSMIFGNGPAAPVQTGHSSHLDGDSMMRLSNRGQQEHVSHSREPEAAQNQSPGLSTIYSRSENGGHMKYRSDYDNSHDTSQKAASPQRNMTTPGLSTICGPMMHSSSPCHANNGQPAAEAHSSLQDSPDRFRIGTVQGIQSLAQKASLTSDTSQIKEQFGAESKEKDEFVFGASTTFPQKGAFREPEASSFPISSQGDAASSILQRSVGNDTKDSSQFCPPVTAKFRAGSFPSGSKDPSTVKLHEDADLNTPFEKRRGQPFFWLKNNSNVDRKMSYDTDDDIFDVPSSGKRHRPKPYKPMFFQSLTKKKRTKDVNLYSKSDARKKNTPYFKYQTPASNTTEPPESILNSKTASKLKQFSEKLRALKTPAPRKFAPRQEANSEMSRLSGSRRSLISTPGGKNATVHLPEPDLFVSVVEGRGAAKGEVGLAAFQISNPVLILCQFSDSPTYPRTLSKLMSFNPIEVVMPGSVQFPGRSGKADGECKLSEEITNFLPHANIVRVQRKHYDDKKGLSEVQKIRSGEGNSSGSELLYQNKFYCLAAASALIKYLEFTEGVMFHPNSVRVSYQSADQCTLVDPLTAEQVELITSVTSNKDRFSLFGCLNHCTTRGGTRLLRSNLFQPSKDEKAINSRLAAVEELVEKPQLHQGLKNSLAKFQDMELILSLCVQQQHPNGNPVWLEKKMDRMIGLKGILEYLEPLSILLQDVTSSILVSARDLITKHSHNCRLLLEMLNLVINKNAYQQRRGASSLRFARAMVIKPNTNLLLDMDRAAMCENVDDLESHAKKLEDEHGIPVKLLYSNSKGFYINIPEEKGRKITELPEVFHRVHRQKNGFNCVTEFLSMKDKLIQENLKEISIISDTILDEVLKEVREYIWFMYQLSETISLLDLMCALASVSCGSDYCKPEFGNSIAIRGSRHPILEHIVPEVVSNDIYADEEQRMVVLTGPNMSGKSTYLRQIVLICMMAQIGCFVPAIEAKIRIPDRIFSRMSNRDSIETNCSSFMLEMKEVANIVNERTGRSLIIIDELGRSTSVEEGSAICWAVCEHLLRGRDFVFLATHFCLLPDLANLYPVVANFHFQPSAGSPQNQEETNFLHKLVRGRRELGVEENYGIEMASRTNLDREVISKAREFVPQISFSRAGTSTMDRFDQQCLNLLRAVKQIANSNLPDQELIENLRVLKLDFIRETKKLTSDPDK